MHEFKEFLERFTFPEPSKLEVSQKLLADTDLSGNTLRALLMIDYFTRPSGFCDVDNRTLERQFPKMNGNLFKYYLSILQKKGALFKKIKPIPKRSGGGSRRILVIEKHWVNAINIGSKNDASSKQLSWKAILRKPLSIFCFSNTALKSLPLLKPYGFELYFF